MNLHLTIPKELGRRLLLEAQKRGAPVDVLATELIEQALPMSDKARSAIHLLEEWAAEDEHLSDHDAERHRAALQALDDDRSSDRQLFGRVLSEKPQ